MKISLLLAWLILLTSCTETSSNSSATKKTNEGTIRSDKPTKPDAPIPAKKSEIARKKHNEDFGIGLNEERTYYATDTLKNLNYELTVRNIGNDSLSYKFSTINESSELNELIGKLGRKKRTSSSVTKRYNTQSRAFIYEINNDKVGTELVIEAKESDFVRFYHFPKDVETIRFGETDPKIIGVRYLSMKVRNPSNDYGSYFKRMIDLLGDSYSGFMQTDSGSTEYQKWFKNHQTNLAKFSNLISEYDTASSNYDFQEDSILLNRISYNGLDSAQKILESFGITFVQHELPERDQFIPIDFKDALVVDLLTNRNEGINAGKFFKMKFTNNLGHDHLKFEEHLWKLYSRWDDFFQYDSLYVGLFRSFGFETVNHLITLWEPDADSLKLKEILNKIIPVGIGGIEIDTVFSIPGDKTLFVGTKSGGDGGEVWGGFWIGCRTQPGKMEMIYEKSYGGNSENYETIRYSFLNDSILELESIRRFWNSGNKKDSLLSKESVNLFRLADVR